MGAVGRWTAVLAALVLVGAGRLRAGELEAMDAFVPEVLPASPLAELSVSFGAQRMEFGTHVTPTDSQAPPHLAWDAEPGTFYTVAITNPDIPSIEEHTYGELIHWLVGNVKENEVESGEPIREYLSPGAPKGSGVHRYLVLVFQQPGHLDFAGESRINATALDDRFHFSMQSFALKHGLQLPPAAGNFFQSAWDPTVDKLAEIRTYKGKSLATIKP